MEKENLEKQIQKISNIEMFLKEKIAVHIFLKFISIFIEKENETEKNFLKNEIVNLKNEVEKLKKVVKKCEEEDEKTTVAI